jgi:hypothetical protein
MDQLKNREVEVQELKRERDLFLLRHESTTKENESYLRQLDERDAKIRELQNSVKPERDRLCENKLAYNIRPQPLPKKPFNQLLTIRKPRTVVYRIRIITSSDIQIPLVAPITSYSQGPVTSDHKEPISEISFRGGIQEEYAFPIDAEEPFSIKCIGRVS